MKTSFVFMTVLALLATLVVGCAVPGVPTPPSSGLSTGTIEVRVTDAPPEYGEIEKILVTVVDSEEAIMVHKAVAEQEHVGGGTQNQVQNQVQQGGGTWINIPVTGDNTFDLLELKEQGVDLLLGSAEVSTGKYTQIRMTIEEVTVIFDDGTEQGKSEKAKLPSGQLKFVRPFDVVEGETTILLIDFDADKSVVVTGAGKVIVKPVVKLLVSGVPEALEITTTSLPNGGVGVDYTATVEATGGTGSYTWSISEGDLPDELELNTETGEIFGTPTTADVYNFTVHVEDESDPVQSDTQDFSISIAAAGVLIITTTSLPDGEVGEAYTATVEAIGGTGPYEWTISDGDFPDDLELDDETGEIFGTPTTADVYNFTVHVEDESDPVQSDTQELSIHIDIEA